MNPDTLIGGAFALIALAVIIADKVSNHRTIGALTDALAAARNDKPLIDEIHNMAVNVVPIDVLHKALDTINTLAGVAKQYLPKPIDDAIDQGKGLADDIVNDNASSGANTPPGGTQDGALSGAPSSPMSAQAAS